MAKNRRRSIKARRPVSESLRPRSRRQRREAADDARHGAADAAQSRRHLLRSGLLGRRSRSSVLRTWRARPCGAAFRPARPSGGRHRQGARRRPSGLRDEALKPGRMPSARWPSRRTEEPPSSAGPRGAERMQARAATNLETAVALRESSARPHRPDRGGRHQQVRDTAVDVALAATRARCARGRAAAVKSDGQRGDRRAAQAPALRISANKNRRAT